MSLLVSIISHNQGDFVFSLLKDLQQFCPHQEMEVIVTLNCREKISFTEKDFDFKLEIIQNPHPKGFGANHNAAFKLRPADFFGVLNPDLKLIKDPFQPLMARFTDRQIGVIAPLIFNQDHSIEDSARRLPTPFRLLWRNISGGKKAKFDYEIGNNFLSPDWVAGIFILFPRTVFAEMNGFDERFYLYFEDVDLCSRLRLSGYKVVLDPSVSVVHEARRDSHKNIRYFMWHILSGLRFFSSRVFRECLLNRSNKMVNPPL